MKKLLLTIAFLFALGITYAQEQPTVTETERIIDKYVDKAGDAINKLATALQVPAEHVYSVLVKQQIVIGITILVAFIGFTALFTLCAVWVKKLDEWDDFWAMFLMVIFGVLAGVSFILLCTNGIPSLLNPEYGAIKEIMEVLT